MSLSKGPGTAAENEPDYKDPRVCQQLKKLHDDCFYQWYHDDFLSGRSKDPQPCMEQWGLYQLCVQKRLHALEIDSEQLVIATPKSNSK
ncbi:MAG: hypothetical protein Q8P67_18035 [archaeon]|nr:hypothetical protein [archaeon]